MPDLTREEVERRLADDAAARRSLSQDGRLLCPTEREALQTALSLFDRAEQAGERMRELEGAIQRVEREAVVHTHPVGNGVKFEGHLVPNGAMMQLLAALKEAPDA